MLEEIAGGDHLLELFGTDEVVVLAVHFTRAHRTRSEGNRQGDLRITRQRGVDDAALAGAGGGGNEVQRAARDGVRRRSGAEDRARTAEAARNILEPGPADGSPGCGHATLPEPPLFAPLGEAAGPCATWASGGLCYNRAVPTDSRVVCVPPRHPRRTACPR
ncbi:hypothetical protein G6F50_015290 [Rhizopus delemar]|uniref:Uncharacterized protein n=1 Tax=Rhizopus delemar TaxID=936053 RepID=A0A9P6XZ78_9FUNG|nr:hypothetical protein G6F50_015290 [Rhizopus delemar]